MPETASWIGQSFYSNNTFSANLIKSLMASEIKLTVKHLDLINREYISFECLNKVNALGKPQKRSASTSGQAIKIF